MLCVILTGPIPFSHGHLFSHREVTAASRWLAWDRWQPVLWRGEEQVRSGQELRHHKDSHRLDVTDISVHTALLHSLVQDETSAGRHHKKTG